MVASYEIDANMSVFKLYGWFRAVEYPCRFVNFVVELQMA